MSNPQSPKLFILLGETGCGKSSFVNCLAGVRKDTKLAKEGGTIKSCTDKPSCYEFEREGFGNVIIIDAEGMNDTNEVKNEKSILDIFKMLFNRSSDYVVDAIFYLEAAASSKSHCDKYLNIFSHIFKVDKEVVKGSTIYVHSKYEDLTPKKKKEHENKIKEIATTYNIVQINWDNKYDIDDENEMKLYNQQFEELKKLINKVRRFSLRLDHYKYEITEIAKQLREADKILKNETVSKRETIRLENNSQVITHVEDVSKVGIVSIFSLGLSKLLKNKYVGRTLLNLPNPSLNANTVVENKRVKNFRYTITEKSDVHESDEHKISIWYNDDKKSVFCSFFVDATLFGNGWIKFEVKYDYEFDTVTTDDVKNIQYRHDVEHYIKAATDRFTDF